MTGERAGVACIRLEAAEGEDARDATGGEKRERHVLSPLLGLDQVG